jgi:negative regulator of sigma E activity
MNDYINAMTNLNQQEMTKVRAKARDETKYKIEAMTKLEGLRQELQMIQGNDQVSLGFWKE